MPSPTPPARRPQKALWRALASGIVAMIGVVLIGRHYYFSLPEPRYWLPKSADDWAAWGTCIGSIFTGTALLFTGFQIRNQVRAGAEDSAERERSRLAAAKQVQWRVSVETYPTAVQGTLEDEEAAVLAPASEVKATIHLPATRGVTGLAISFPSTLAIAPYELTNAYVEARNNGCAIASNPTCIWLSRERAMRTIGPSNYQHWPLQKSYPVASPDGSTLYIDGTRLGESLEVAFWTTDPLTDLHLMFTDDNGSRFSLSAGNTLIQVT